MSKIDFDNLVEFVNDKTFDFRRISRENDL